MTYLICGLQSSSESCRKPYLLPALVKEPCHLIRYTFSKSHRKFQVRFCSSSATRKILWCQDLATGGFPSFSRQVNTLLCLSGNLQLCGCIGGIMNTLHSSCGSASILIHLSLPWTRQSQMHCAFSLHLNALPQPLPVLSQVLLAHQYTCNKADSEERAKHEHGWTETTLSHLQHLSFVKSSSPAGLQFDFKKVESARLLGSLPVQPSNARCQLSWGNRANPYSLPGYERQNRHFTISCH